ncbi:hypothetical protein Tsubulata_028477 [Turnera subulata]|uniref:Uncharacterized protein n=1 Tax=Turnera subulata TaxID=218843 RepID=A0A9Q0FNB6_9ROSI|nr:hypothetical protein Tsubulata_028477 [Turnera subulata]
MNALLTEEKTIRFGGGGDTSVGVIVQLPYGRTLRRLRRRQYTAVEEQSWSKTSLTQLIKREEEEEAPPSAVELALEWRKAQRQLLFMVAVARMKGRLVCVILGVALLISCTVSVHLDKIMLVKENPYANGF